MTYEETLAYIHSTCWLGSRPGLRRITHLLQKLGDPQKELRIIHVAGTNGKGSFCAMLESVLQKAGYRVGTFTSPYIEHFEERIRIGGENIDRDLLCRVTERVRPFADAMEDPPTEFELITAIGLEAFREARVDPVILECGMGGRLDSTNVAESPLLSVITGIALDHTAYLGDTVEKIAAEKAGILKPGCPVLYGGNDSAAGAVIAAAAKEKTCPLTVTDRSALHLRRFDTDGTVFDFQDYTELHIGLLGSYQPYNAANVITAVKLLRQGGMTVSDAALREGLSEAKWKGRFERLWNTPPIFFDGGHNEEGVHAAVRTVQSYFPGQKILLLSGVLADKAYETMAAVMAPIAEKVFTVTPENPRALSGKDYAEVFHRLSVDAEAFDSYESAVKAAVAEATKRDLPLLALGSLYSYAQFKPALQNLLHR